MKATLERMLYLMRQFIVIIIELHYLQFVFGDEEQLLKTKYPLKEINKPTHG
jgi:hypothetical protein